MMLNELLEQLDREVKLWSLTPDQVPVHIEDAYGASVEVADVVSMNGDVYIQIDDSYLVKEID